MKKNNARSYRSGGSGYGILYNWYAATAGTTSHTDVTKGYRAPGSICPKGWQLPVGGGVGVDKSYAKMVKAYYGKSAEGDNANVNTSTSYIFAAEPLKFLSSGMYDLNNGYYTSYNGVWSGNLTSDTYSVIMRYASSSIQPNNERDGYRYGGSAVRCVVR